MLDVARTAAAIHRAAAAHGLEGHAGVLADLGPLVVHGILRLRSDVFVVEQACAYADPDDADAHATTVHAWMAEAGTTAPVAYLRALEQGADVRIGRVVTAPAHRGRGLAAALVAAATAEALGVVGPDGAVRLEAQAHLEAFYARLGYATCGPGYVEDGIPHLPMRHGG